MKIQNAFLIGAIFMGIFACTENNGDNDEKGMIDYPDSGSFGVNILFEDSVEIISTRNTSPYQRHCSMRAVLSEDASLVIVIHRTSSSAVNSWSMEAINREGWIVHDKDGMDQEFEAYGPQLCEMKLTFYETGSAEIRIFENGSQEPVRVKNIHWAPFTVEK